MTSNTVWTLPQVAQLLDEPQHRLIYLCEKGVVVPDLADARGRGTSRRFSTRNILEFALALRLRKLLAVESVAAILRTLRLFQETVARAMPETSLVDALRQPDGVRLRLLVRDGEELFILLARGQREGRLFGGVDLSEASSLDSEELFLRLRPRRTTNRPGFLGPERSRYMRLDININQIARDLRFPK